VRDGWLHTGDSAKSTPTATFRITGRQKELIVSSSARRFVRRTFESLCKVEPIVSHSAFGDRMPYVAALLTINPAVAARYRAALPPTRCLPRCAR